MWENSFLENFENSIPPSYKGRGCNYAISFKKTKTQVFNNEDLANQNCLFCIGPEKVENAKSFIYLGKVITMIPIVVLLNTY